MPPDELHQLAITVARIEGKLDGALAVTTDHETRLRATEHAIPDRLTARLEALERWRWMQIGGASLVSGGLGSAITALLTSSTPPGH